MVYLCWERGAHLPTSQSLLVAVFPSEGEAAAFCEARAAELAAGSGLVCQSMLGDEWEAQTTDRRVSWVRWDAVEFGRLTPNS